MTCRVPRLWPLLLASALATIIVVDSANARSDSVDQRHVADLRDLNRLSQRHPEASALFERAEATLAEGDVDGAARLFQRVVAAAPESSLAQRRLCQAQTEQGLRLSAIDACTAAIRSGASPMDLHALVRALVSAPPTAEQLSMALQAARQAKTSMPDQPWGYAAECDIAVRLGDETMFNTCQADLERIAPGHSETLRIARARSTPTPWASLAGWLLLAATLLAGAAHAIRERLSGASARRVTAAIVLPALLLTVSPVHAERAPDEPVQGLSKWAIDEKNPVASVPKPEERDQNPLQYGYFLMDLGLLSENAIQAQDFAKAARLYEAMAKAVPDEALGYRKACENYARIGERDKARALCARALTVHGVTLDDYASFTRLELAGTAPLDPARVEGVSQLIDHLRRENGATLAAARIECELAVRIEDATRLRRCTKLLSQKAPSDPQTLTYRWALALKEGDFDAARSIIEQAKRAAVEPAAIARMQAATGLRSSLGARLTQYWKLEAALLLLLAAGSLMWAALRKRETPMKAATS